MDGLALLRGIKERWPAYPVMMVTAYGDDERRRLAGEYGAEFITKPVDFGALKVPTLTRVQLMAGPVAFSPIQFCRKALRR
jgi:DNA-binding response OmpR family regulator